MEKEKTKPHRFRKAVCCAGKKEDDTQKTTTSARFGKKDQGESKYKKGQREKAPCHKQRRFDCSERRPSVTQGWGITGLKENVQPTNCRNPTAAWGWSRSNHRIQCPNRRQGCVSSDTCTISWTHLPRIHHEKYRTHRSWYLLNQGEGKRSR